MQRVLLDGTTLMSAGRLLARVDPPSALNVWSLSLLVESLILHQEILVLDTGGDDDGQLAATAATAGLNGVVRVEHRSVDEIVDRYVSGEISGLARSALEVAHDSGGELLRRSNQHLIDTADHHLKGMLEERRYPDDTHLADYLAGLDAFHEQQIKRRSKKAKSKDTFGPMAPSQYGTPLGALGGTRAELMARSRFLNRYWDGAHMSPWVTGGYYRESANFRFTRSILIRTHLYLVASQVVGAPYRADILRAPICLRFFGEEANRRSIEERFVDAAEDVERERVRQINDFLGRPGFVTIPLFLAHVFARSRTAADVVDIALHLRESRAATRFREQFVALYAAEASGDIGMVAAEIGRYAEMLTREYGSSNGTAHGVWSFAASAANVALSASPSNLVGLGVEMGKGTVAVTGIYRSWAYRRRMALISQSIRRVKQTGSLQPHLKRIFGARLSDAELEFLRKVDQVSADPSR